MSLVREVVTARLSFDPRVVIDHPSGYLALSSRNRRFLVPGLSGFVAYREKGLQECLLEEAESLLYYLTLPAMYVCQSGVLRREVLG